ncbi:uncharacterized protein [Battus philenor]|uniref:uncharacterized protein n=1 Tax=Battus philenor TaxID=42288 RepID=UPI0035D0AAB6
MWTRRLKLWRFMLCILFAVSALTLAARADDDDVPLESQCRPYIEKALKELESGDAEPDSSRNDSSEASVDDDSLQASSAEELDNQTGEEYRKDDNSQEDISVLEFADEPYVSQTSEEEEGPEDNVSVEDAVTELDDKSSAEEQTDASEQDNGDSKEEASADDQNVEIESVESIELTDGEEDKKEDSSEGEVESKEEEKSGEILTADASIEGSEEADQQSEEEDKTTEDENETKETSESKEDNIDSKMDESKEDKTDDEDDGSQEKAESAEKGEDEQTDSGSQEIKDEESSEKETEEVETDAKSEEDRLDSEETKESEEVTSENEDKDESGEIEKASVEEAMESEDKSAEVPEDSSTKSEEDTEKSSETQDDTSAADEEDKSTEAAEDKSGEAGDQEEEQDEEGTPEEELLKTGEIPENLRSRDHIIQILRLDEEASEAEMIIEKSADIVLRDLKRLYENSIKPLEGLYKYRDLSNRHFGDPEIFSKPLVLFMGPWSGGKSSILNYLTGLEFTEWSLRTGAEPSPAYFNILMHGKDPEVLDGTQLAADWTFSGLQKFGQGLEERLRGLKYPSRLLEKVNIVEIPGILEVRKQVSRVFPFNDACQWFIDRADIIFLVYDPSKLDVGPETEAILDQLKGRESQTRIVLNKADTVKPEELMRVQSALIWNISPLMSSAQPPVMYTVSLWSMPFEPSAPARLLQAQERELLRDLRQAVDRRIENKIASARRFAVRVRNHAKMVDCYLTTYYNHKTIFGNKKLIADAIIENPQNYHIYEGLSTLTNISRYDLPDPETYRDFFRLNPLYEFQQLSSTCTYFRGCPITRLDVAIAYDLPELVGKYKKMVETATPQGMPKS